MSEQATASIIPISIEKEMKSSYLDYAMSVIVSRAIPDARDGLKPVHRRIVYAMYDGGNHWNRSYRKSARIVGEVMGKYHPHGDSAIYDALVRMAQNFSMGIELVDGQGNFGSMDGDSPAAMRYTESRMSKAAHALIEDIDKDTVDWQDNYDGTEREPKVLPAQFPNLLVNGAGGIAVGMATNIPTHNLGEVIDATCAVMDNPEITIDELLEIIPAPDFPTGGVILGRSGSRNAMQTGRGSVIMRGTSTVEELSGGKEAIIITSIPYQVNKASLVEKIAELVKEKRVEGITDLRDESDKSGVRIVIELRRDIDAAIMLNQLYKYTPLQTSFGVNMLALDRGRPRLMNLKEVLDAFIEFREEVITRRTNYLLLKARDRAHVLIGLTLAVDNIDEVISIIRSSPDVQVAKERLIERDWPAGGIAPLVELVDDPHSKVIDGKCKFTETQAKAILEMRLSRLTGLERDKLQAELEELGEEIKGYLEILGDRSKLLGMLRDELVAVKEQFAIPRRTEIEASEFEEDIEDLIPREDMVVTVTMGGYIKRVPLSTYRAQRRGGKGRSGMSMKDEDAITEVFITDTHTPVLFFSTRGIVYKLKVYKLPMGGPNSKGRSLMNVFPLKEGETINQIMPLPEDEDAWDNMDIMFATASGNIRRNKLSDFKLVQSNGKIAMKLNDDDQLIGVKVGNPEDHILLAAKSGKALRCPIESVRVFKGRNSVGVRGMNLADGDKLISMCVLYDSKTEVETRDAYLKIPVEQRMQLAAGEEIFDKVETDLDKDTVLKLAENEQFILTATQNGYGKRTSAYEYRTTNRGGKGIVNIVTNERNGEVIGSFPVEQEDQVMLITDAGKLIRIPIHDVRIAGRNTQGVTLFRVGEEETITSMAYIPASDEEEVDELEEENVEGAEAPTAEASAESEDQSEEATEEE